MSRYYRNNPDEPIRHDWLSIEAPKPYTGPLAPQPCPSHSNRACADCGEWAATSSGLCEDCQEDSEHD